jgi:outer membrane protein OmpA-like peptidoglycan-associated protein
LAVIADGINRAIAANPSEVFLIENHTDAVGSDIDNLSLSDRRAESVALVLSQQFGVPPENLTTQGYGAHYLKIPNPGLERAKPCHGAAYHAALNWAKPTPSASTSVRGY